MAIQLPGLHQLDKIDGGAPDANAVITPTTGAGSTQTILRPGRFSVSVQMATRDEDCAGDWLAAQLRHSTEGLSVRLIWPRPAGQPEGVTVDGAGQAGALLSMKGFVPGQVVKAFTPFSFVAGGVNYMHRTTAAGVADSAGKLTTPIGPRMRVSPADALALNFATPAIEGNLDPGGMTWTVDRLTLIGMSFKITER